MSRVPVAYLAGGSYGRGRELAEALRAAADPRVRAGLEAMKPARAKQLADEVRTELLRLPRNNGRDGYGHYVKGCKLPRGPQSLWAQRVRETVVARCADPAYKARLLAQLAQARANALAKLATRPRHKGKFVKVEVAS